LANHFCECCGYECDWKQFPTAEHQKLFIKHYLTTFHEKSGSKKTVNDKEIDDLYKEVQAFILMSHLFWGIWALVQARHSVIDFDYLSYGLTRIKAYYEMKDNCLRFVKA